VPKILRRLSIMLITAVISVYALLLLTATQCDRLIFQPHPSSYSLRELQSGSIQAYSVDSSGAKIAAIYLPNPRARYTLLYSHGNGEDIGDDLPFLEEFRRAGFAVFAYDYEGYGESAGRPSERGLYRDVEAAYDFLTGNLKVRPETVIAHGHSLGAAAAIHLASVRPVAGLIADAPFVSAFRVVTRAQILPWDKFNNARTIQRVHCPVLVVHGRNDLVIPCWHGERIYKLANAPKQCLWIESCGHNDTMLVAREQYIRALQDFVRSIDTAQAKAAL